MKTSEAIADIDASWDGPEAESGVYPRRERRARDRQGPPDEIMIAQAVARVTMAGSIVLLGPSCGLGERAAASRYPGIGITGNAQFARGVAAWIAHVDRVQRVETPSFVRPFIAGDHAMVFPIATVWQVGVAAVDVDGLSRAERREIAALIARFAVELDTADRVTGYDPAAPRP